MGVPGRWACTDWERRVTHWNMGRRASARGQEAKVWGLGKDGIWVPKGDRVGDALKRCSTQIQCSGGGHRLVLLVTSTVGVGGWGDTACGQDHWGWSIGGAGKGHLEEAGNSQHSGGKGSYREELQCSFLAQWAENPALSLPWHGLDPWPGNIHMMQAWPKKISNTIK